jgi:hypothetical protein
MTGDLPKKVKVFVQNGRSLEVSLNEFCYIWEVAERDANANPDAKSLLEKITGPGHEEMKNSYARRREDKKRGVRVFTREELEETP